MSTEKPRFTITVTPEMLKAIDDYRYARRIPTRTKAVNELFVAGLKAVQDQKGEASKEPRADS